MKDCFRQIVLKKSTSNSTAEKYAPEIEIRILGRTFRRWISRSNVQNRCFHPSVFERFVQTDVFKRIGQKLTFDFVCERPFAALGIWGI